jgi:hypothetical protein
MGKIALSQNTSLDGVMQSPGPADVPFKYRGWAVDFDGGPEGARFNYEEEVGLGQAQNSEALLLGRVTYEAMQAFWPTAEGQLADRLNELPKYVVSSRGARRRDPRLWQPPPLAGTDRDGAGRRAAPTGLPAGARCRRSAVRGDAGQDPAASGRIASARGRRGEHDLCTCHGGRVMRTLGITSWRDLPTILRRQASETKEMRLVAVCRDLPPQPVGAKHSCSRCSSS